MVEDSGIESALHLVCIKTQVFKRCIENVILVLGICICINVYDRHFHKLWYFLKTDYFSVSQIDNQV